MPRPSETDRKHVRDNRAPMSADPGPSANHAYAKLRQRADSGCADAQYALGLLWAARAQSRRAARWYALAASQNLPEAMYALSLCYLRGYGVARSLAASRRWAQRCEQQLADGATVEPRRAASVPTPLLRATETRHVEVRRIGGSVSRRGGRADLRNEAGAMQGAKARSSCAASNSGNVSPLRLAVSAWP